jgi:hypothetical protein
VIIFILQNMPVLRKLQYFGTPNVIEQLSECFRKISVLIIPHIKLNATVLKLTMERLI